jgi:DNA-binding CsgD family transcriptional regulator
VAAEAAQFQRRPDQAEAELAALADAATSDAERARVALVRFDNAFLRHGQGTDLRAIEDAIAAVSDPYWRDELLTRRSVVNSVYTTPRAALETASDLLQRRPPEPLGIGHLALSYSLARLGRLDDAQRLLTPTAGSRQIPGPDEPWEQWALFSMRAIVHIYSGRFGEAEELLLRAQQQVADHPAAEGAAHVSHRMAVLNLEQGRPASAFRRASESYTLFRNLGRTFATRWPYLSAVQALAMTGQVDRAAETLAAHDALEMHMVPIDNVDLLQARAWMAVATGDLTTARTQLEAAADLGEEIGDLVGAASALHGLARLGRSGRVATAIASRLADLAEQVDGDLVTARAAYASALANRNSEALDKVAADFEDLGALLYAAEANAEAAVLLRHAGKPREAAAAEQKAARLLSHCEGAVTPAVQGIMARVHLTLGELDTARQAAAGRTNKQIANDMHLSVRTVESHLQRVYEKLGISGRHELADALQDHPPA